MFKSSSISHTFNYESDCWVRVVSDGEVSTAGQQAVDLTEWSKVHLRWDASDQILFIYQNNECLQRLSISQIDCVRRRNRKLRDDIEEMEGKVVGGDSSPTIFESIKQRLRYGSVKGDLISVRFNPSVPADLSRAEPTSNWLVPAPANDEIGDNGENLAPLTAAYTLEFDEQHAVNPPVQNQTYFEIDLPVVRDMRDTPESRALKQQKLRVDDLLIASSTMEESRQWLKLLSSAVNDRWLQTMAKCFEKRSALSTYNSYAGRVPIAKSAHITSNHTAAVKDSTVNKQKQQQEKPRGNSPMRKSGSKKQQSQPIERPDSIMTASSAANSSVRNSNEIAVVVVDDTIATSGSIEERSSSHQQTFEMMKNRQMAILVPHIPEVSNPEPVSIPRQNPTQSAKARNNRVTAIIDNHISTIRPLQLSSYAGSLRSHPAADNSISERSSRLQSRLVELESKQSKLNANADSASREIISHHSNSHTTMVPVPLPSARSVKPMQQSLPRTPSPSSSSLPSPPLAMRLKKTSPHNSISPSTATTTMSTDGIPPVQPLFTLSETNESDKASTTRSPSMRTASIIRLTQLASNGDQFVNLIELRRNINSLKSQWAQWLQKWWLHIAEKPSSSSSTSTKTAVNPKSSTISVIKPISTRFSSCSGATSGSRVFSIICDYERVEFDQELADILDQSLLVRRESAEVLANRPSSLPAVEDLGKDISRFQLTLSTLQKQQTDKVDVELTSIADLLTQLSDIGDRIEELRSSEHWSQVHASEK